MNGLFSSICTIHMEHLETKTKPKPKKCEHGRQKFRCKECGGSSICSHGREKSQCKECGGSGLCSHGRQKSRCKECGGSSICEHGRLKSYCKECGGSGLCKSEWCETIKNRKYRGYCLICFIHLFPDEKVARNYKTKENSVNSYIKEKFQSVDWTCDKVVQNGCSRRRPDMLADLGSHVVIIEIDENRHDEYECICENRRIMEISKDLGHRPVVFIRFNPDGYERVDGTKLTSPWRLNGLGICVVMKTREKEWNERLSALEEMTGYWLTHVPEKTVEVVELFY